MKTGKKSGGEWWWEGIGMPVISKCTYPEEAAGCVVWSSEDRPR